MPKLLSDEFRQLASPVSKCTVDAFLGMFTGCSFAMRQQIAMAMESAYNCGQADARLAVAHPQPELFEAQTNA